MAKKEQKQKKRGPFTVLGRLAVVGATAYLVVSFVGGQLQVAQKQRDLAEAQARLAVKIEENTELQRILDSGDSAAYIEKVARERGYARPDERLYVDITGE